jgi:ribonuclease HII
LTSLAADLWQHENAARQAGFVRIAGIDEVGRGPLAGPVLAACVVLPPGFSLSGINDSKKLTERQRERAEVRIRAEALCIGIGSVEPETIDQINILQATHEAMRLAYSQIDPLPDFVLIDGLPVRGFPCAHQQALVQGDSRSVSIAAASIVAKVARDRLMRAYDLVYPEYGFASHKGYGSATHLAALTEFGPCPLHRRSFSPVAACVRQILKKP